MAQIEIYTTPLCPYCAAAKKLLKSKGADFTEFDLWAEGSKKDEMVARAQGRTSVPQIFINGEHIGGSDELHALDKAGGLDAKLAA